MALLTTLQHADSFFPAGAVSFSWGVETLQQDGLLQGSSDLASFMEGQLRHRWATFDRPATVLAHRAGGDLDGVQGVDESIETMTLAREAREGSRRQGRALLGVHAALETPGSVAYRSRVTAAQAPGHVAAAQGLCWHAVGMTEAEVSVASAHCYCIAVLGAAVRLALVGHLDAQRILTALAPTVAALAIAALPELSSYTPATDVAMMRHERQSVRLFSN